MFGEEKNPHIFAATIKIIQVNIFFYLLFVARKQTTGLACADTSEHAHFLVLLVDFLVFKNFEVLLLNFVYNLLKVYRMT